MNVFDTTAFALRRTTIKMRRCYETRTTSVQAWPTGVSAQLFGSDPSVVPKRSLQSYPSLFQVVRSAAHPTRMRATTCLTCDARCNGVCPSLFWAVGMRATFTCPTCDARCNKVCSSLLWAVGSVLRSISTRAISSCLVCESEVY